MVEVIAVEDHVSMLLGQVMALANEVNNTTDFCVRVTFIGHVKSLQTDISRSKAEYNEDLAMSWISLDSPYVDAQAKLRNVISNLKHVRATRELPDLPTMTWGHHSSYLDLSENAKASAQLGGTSETLR